MTVAAFMERALYDPERGYYARAARRSGRAGDFFTSVDVGPLFGQLLEIQIAEMFGILEPSAVDPQRSAGQRAASDARRFDLVEAGAGNGRLSADILRAARERDSSFYSSIQLHLVEASAPARAAQHAMLGEAADRLVWSSASLPESYDGVLVANELLDAMPVHQVVMRADGLKEVFVEGHRLVEGEPSTGRLAEYLDAAGATLEPGWRAEINLNAVDWVREAARRLRRGFIILIDYGHEARELYSVTHASGTLTTFTGHRSSGPESAGPAWLQNPGEQDITAHVDFTSVKAAARSEGAMTIALVDQTYFLLGIVQSSHPPPVAGPQLKTLLLPGGLGSTMKVLILGKNVGAPRLAGCSFSTRLT